MNSLMNEVLCMIFLFFVYGFKKYRENIFHYTDNRLNIYLRMFSVLFICHWYIHFSCLNRLSHRVKKVNSRRIFRRNSSQEKTHLLRNPPTKVHWEKQLELWCDRSDIFPFDYEPNVFLYDSQIRRKTVNRIIFRPCPNYRHANPPPLLKKGQIGFWF